MTKGCAEDIHATSRSGCQPWLDNESLLPGQDWDSEIRKAIREAHVFLVCLSSRSVTKRGYVQKEIKFALDAATEISEGNIHHFPSARTLRVTTLTKQMAMALRHTRTDTAA